MSKKQKKQSNPKGKRQLSDIFLITGLNGVTQCLKSPYIKVVKLFVKKGFPINQLGPLKEVGKVQWLEEKAPELRELHQGIGCQILAPDWGPYQNFLDQLQTKPNPLILVLDQIEDPNNLGQILRTCECAGVDSIFLPGRRTVHLTQAAAQTSQGAFAWVPLHNVGNLKQALDNLKERGFWLFACENSQNARLWHQANFSGPVVIVLGSEGKGIRHLTLKACDDVLRIPMLGRINSLNVSATAAAILFEALRQRQNNK